MSQTRLGGKVVADNLQAGEFELAEETCMVNALGTRPWAAGKRFQAAYLGWAGTVAVDSVSRRVYTRSHSKCVGHINIRGSSIRRLVSELHADVLKRV